MREIRATKFEPIGGNLHMVIKATGKPLVIRLCDVRARQGDTIWIDDWLYQRIKHHIRGAHAQRDQS